MNTINTSYATRTTVSESANIGCKVPTWWDGQGLWLTWGPTTPGGPGGPVLPWNPCVFKTKKKRSYNWYQKQSWRALSSDWFTHSFSSLSRMSGQSVFPCGSLRYTYKSMNASMLYDKGNKSMVSLCKDWCEHVDSREGPLILGNLWVPEGLADPETNNQWLQVSHQLSFMEWLHVKRITWPWMTVQWYTPSPQEVLVGHRFLSYPERTE